MTLNLPGLPQKIVAVKAEKRSIEQVQQDIYDSHRHRIFSVAFYMTGNELAAEEIVKESFIDAFTAVSKPDGQAIDSSLMRQLNARFSFSTAETAAPLQTSMEIRTRNVGRTDLEEALQQLPPAERLLFLFRDVEGYAPGEISALTGMPQAQVNRTLFSARIRLRNILAAA